MRKIRFNGKRKAVTFSLTVAVLMFLTVIGQGQGVDPLTVLNGMEAAYAKVNDYTAIFLKRELVKGELLPEETVSFKFKKPFKVYMKWLKGPHDGREAMYVQGKYGNKVVGHEGGFFGFITLHMDPGGKTAMKGNRHPITDVGIGRLVEIVMENVRRAQDNRELDIKYPGGEEVFGRRVYHVEAAFPPDKGYYGGRVETWVDMELGLPIKIMIYDWGGGLLESYGYRDLRINPGLSDAEFDEDYKEYDF